MIHQGTNAVFSPYPVGRDLLPTATQSLQKRQDDSCIQTIEVPVWYGSDYNTCSMQSMTAPCSVSFPAASCHTHSPPSQPLPKDGLPGSTKLWIIIGVSIFFVIFIPVVVLWAGWRLSKPRRVGKRSISVQLEKNEASKLNTKESSKSKSALTSSSGSKDQSEASSGGRKVLDRGLNRHQTDAAHLAGKYFYNRAGDCI